MKPSSRCAPILRSSPKQPHKLEGVSRLNTAGGLKMAIAALATEMSNTSTPRAVALAGVAASGRTQWSPALRLLEQTTGKANRRKPVLYLHGFTFPSLLRVDHGRTLGQTIRKLDSHRGLRVGLRRWRNGPTVASTIWWHIRPSRALTRMRSDACGYPLWPGATRSVQGPNTDVRDQLSPNRSHPACKTRPVHTDVPSVAESRAAAHHAVVQTLCEGRALVERSCQRPHAHAHSPRTYGHHGCSRLGRCRTRCGRNSSSFPAEGCLARRLRRHSLPRNL
jgi:hypothetical protein